MTCSSERAQIPSGPEGDDPLTSRPDICAQSYFVSLSQRTCNPGWVRFLSKVIHSPDILEACWQLTDEFCAQAGGNECYPAMLTASGPLSIATLYLPEALASGDILLGFTTYSPTEEIDRVMPLPCWTGKALPTLKS